jgi:orotidine-5'-phosphate decarboxylase
MTEAKKAAMAMTGAKDRLIVALDVESAGEARQLVGELNEYAGAFKVGLQLFTSAGPAFVRELCDAGTKVFLDLKFHDIPNTVAKAGVEAARLGVWMFNVHASGGNEMMHATVSQVSAFCDKQGIERPLIIGVTVLTSSSDDTLRQIGIETSAASQVNRLTTLAKDAGLDGVVASPLETKHIREECGSGFRIVTPGIRPINASNDDQKRVTTPSDAIRNGADHLVVGRPITAASDPAAAAREILQEISEVINA